MTAPSKTPSFEGGGPPQGTLGAHVAPCGATWAHLGSLGALGQLWEALYIEKLPINRTSGRYIIQINTHII